MCPDRQIEVTVSGATDILVIADDLTGALEAGAKFAARGVRAQVTTRIDFTGGEGVPVIDTETRHLPPEEAARIIASIPAASARLIYKKTDSTLRGNIAAELGALAAACPGSTIAYIPAYPAAGRTVTRGELRVHGTPVDRTSFADDPLNPIRDSAIAALLGDNPSCTVHDGETDADVAAAVAAARSDERCRIIAGPASVAEQLAAGFGPPSTPVWPTVNACLIVNGSLHEASSRQIAYAEASGCAFPWRVFHPAIGPGASPLDIAAETARAVLRDLAGFEALMIFGGDTAFAILRELGCALIEPLGEVVTGVPISHVPGTGLHLITKAGGFGGDSLICEVKRILHAD